MDAVDRFHRVAEAFERLRSVERGRQDAVLIDLCRDDPTLADEVRSLLKHHAEEGDSLDRGVMRRGVGAMVGRYRIRGVLGEGGMGSVYLAEQEAPIRREVALKVIKLGMDTRQVVRRFELERQTLARLEHPGIAKVFDGGSTEDGRPYFAMELVRGRPITDYCDGRQLDLAARIRLFVDVCSAVQHAHTKGIIHRDLKPSNILVSEVDGRPVPKIIDFGIAKAMGIAEPAATRTTRAGDAVGTPEYMSPEQASGEEVDGRSDVYALGAILFELLVGTTPRGALATRRRFPGSAGSATAAIGLGDLPPPRPSSLADDRRTAQRARAREAASQRRTDPASLRKALRQDLDWIVLKGLDSDPSRRYPTVAAFADDLERSRRNEAVVARPPTTGYLVAKFARRHVGALVATGLVACALIGGLAVALYGLDTAREERDAAVAARESERIIGLRLREELFASDVERGRQSAASGHFLEFRDLLYSRHLADPRSPHALWALRESQILHPREWSFDLGMPGRVARFTPTGDRAIVCGFGGHPVLLAAEDGRAIRVAEGPAIGAHSLGMDPAGAACVFGDAEGGVWLWRFDERASIEQIAQYCTGEVFVTWLSDGTIATGSADGCVRRITLAPDAPDAPDGTNNESVVELWSWATPVTSITGGIGGRLAAGFADGRVLLDDGERPPRMLDAQNRRVTSVAFDARGERLASGGADRSLRIHDVAGGRRLARFDPGIGASRSIRFDGDEGLLADGWWEIARLDLRSGEVARVLPEVSWAFDRAADGRIMIAPGRFGGVRLAEPEAIAAAPALVSPTPAGWIGRAAGPGDALVASGEGLAILGADGTLERRLSGEPAGRAAISRDRRRVAMLAADQSLSVLQVEDGSILARAGRAAPGEPRALAFDESGRYVAFVRPDWSIAILDVDASDGESSVCEVTEPFDVEPLTIAFSPDGRHLAVGVRQGMLHLIDLDNGARRAHILGTSPFATLFSPDGRSLVVGTWRGDIMLFDVDSGALTTLRGHSSMVNTLAQDPLDSEVFLSAASDGELRCWHWTLRRNLMTLEPFGPRVAILAAGFSESGAEIVAAGRGGGLARISLADADRRIERNLEFERNRLAAERAAGVRRDSPP